MARYNASPARQAVSEYMSIAKKHGLTPTELALAWCNQRWTVTSTIIGATSMKQLKVLNPPPQGPFDFSVSCEVYNTSDYTNLLTDSKQFWWW